ncbi:MAG: alkaline phosphatase family protein [Actinomycetota bacterium]|nr:alkaline phosphatase family protein [Actinomycetota bacterium]
MPMQATSSRGRRCLRYPARAVPAALAAALALGAVPAAGAAPSGAASDPTASARPLTPIHHLVVIIGENHSFDNVFGTYRPTKGNSVLNLLSQHIVTSSGGAGANVSQAAQMQATDTTSNPGHYSVRPPLTAAYPTLPQPNTTYVSPVCDGGQAPGTPDSRFPANLPNGPYQITKFVPFAQPHSSSTCQTGAYVGDPLHRFYQMWQQVNGGSSKLFTWVHQTAGDGNGVVQPTLQGALDMGYYNMAGGDAAGFNFVANNYAMSDNYHQAIMGGTGANHIAIGAANVAVYRSKGKLATPPANQIENPNPMVGTNNYYTQDGYQGGTYSNCSNPSAPGVGSILDFLHTLPYEPFRSGDCKPGAYYMLNNYNPGYNPNGTRVNRTTSPFTVPPQTWPTIADKLQAHGLSWGYFGQGWENGHPTSNYCGICDPFQYATSVMTNPAKRANLQGLSQFESDVAAGHLPAVSFVKPAAPNDGHPGYSTLAAFQNFASRIADSIISKPALFRHTAILITFDEGGGYYDSGYVQPVSFFGDGTRVPMMVVSPWTKPGHIGHAYYDHSSVVKFIEENWGLGTLTRRSFDNLRNPVMSKANPYVPVNAPATGSLMRLFDFRRPQADPHCIPLYLPASAFPDAGKLPSVPASCAAGSPPGS